MMKSAAKQPKYSIALLTLVAMLLIFSSCQENDIAKVKALFNETDADVEIADSVKFTYKEGAYSRAIVTGKTVKRFTNSKNRLEFTDGLLVKFYDKLNLISVMKANYAENNDEEQKVYIKALS